MNVKYGFQNECILITGASRGIGRGIALELAARGYDAAINYASNEEAARETLSLCREAAADSRQSFTSYKADISKPEEIKSMLKAVTGAHENLTGLINNAGVGTLEKRDLLDFSETELERQINTNLRGPMIISREIANYWLSLPRDSAVARSIIFITSVSSDMITPDRSEYCVSKAGLSMAAALFAGRLADSGIGVYEVRPGITKTDMTRRSKDKYEILIKAGTVPMKRWGTPADVARAAAAIISGDMSFSTGSVINVDGGLHIPNL